MKELFGYLVSDRGEVFNKHGRKLKHFDNGRGYRIVSLRVDGKSRVYGVHRLVAMAYIPNPEGLSDVDHIDGDRTNNVVENLRWLSHSDNIKHSYSSGRRDVAGVNNANAKSDEWQVRKVCQMLEEGLTTKAQIAREVGVSRATVNNIFHRRHWTSISADYKW